MRLVPLFFVLGFLGACGSKSTAADPETAATTVSFTDVNVVLTKRCGGSTCHAAGNTVSVNAYVSNEAVFKADKTKVISRVVTLKDMPPTNSTAAQLAMTADERTLLNTFLNQ